MTDAVAILEQDHRAIHALFGEFAESQDMQIATSVCNELMDHLHLEEELIYPILGGIAPELLDQSVVEHRDAKDFIARIQSSAGDRDAIEEVSLLAESISIHFEAEEQTIFPLLRSRIEAAALEQLGVQLEQRKRALSAK